MNILIINHNVQNCGVYQYGKRFASIASKSKKYNFVYLELTSHSELDQKIEELQPFAIIYNHLNGTMPWVTKETVGVLRERGIKQFLIVHNTGYETFFDYYLHQNPYHPSIDLNNFALLRPLFSEYVNKYVKMDNILRIGSFGFGFRIKYFDQICKIVNNEFGRSDQQVEINLHLTESHFCANALDIKSIKQDCYHSITNNNIKLNFTQDFISDEEMLNFLAKNDLNIFLYHNYHGYNGISSTIDYALSVKKPIAICKSNMFSHISNVQPSICVEDMPLINIIQNGFEPLEDKYQAWSNENFILNLERIFEYVK